MFPLCLTTAEANEAELPFFSFLRSLGGSFSSRMIREEALGTTSTYGLLATSNPYSSLTVHDSQLDSDLQTLPVHSGLLNVITDFLRGLFSHSPTRCLLPYPEDQP